MNSTTLNLSEPEIRQVQQVLIDRGFYRGRVDGMLGTETREALISFQRKQGFEASGSIDTRTVTALGLSDRIGQNAQGGVGNQSTSGQGQSGTQAPSTRSGQAPASQPGASGQQPGTSGQANSPSRNQSQSTGSQDNPSAQNQPQPQNQPKPNAGERRGQSDQSGSAPSTTGQGSDTQSPAAGNKRKENRSNNY